MSGGRVHPALPPAARLARQLGLTLVELMVSIAIATTVMSGVVQVLLVSKANFITERELSGLQENARFAMKYLGDEIRMAGFSGCSEGNPTPAFANNIIGSTGTAAWYLRDLGMTGYEYDAGIGLFPAAFSADVLANTDALAVRRADDNGLRVASVGYVGSDPVKANKAHSYKPGQAFVAANFDCSQIGIFQNSGPANAANTADTLAHATGTVVPGNCVTQMGGNFACNSATTTAGTATSYAYQRGSRIMELRSEAYYVGASESDSSVPALFRERMMLNTTTSTLYTAAEELVQGVENMQILYGIDTDADAVANLYVKGNNATWLVLPYDPVKWKRVVTVRLMLRMRSLNPVYNENVAYPVFQDVAGTNGSDRFMRQNVTTTIQLRNSF
ncbi:MAG: hypothetical protein RLZZ227_2224 [Pseudomonadota bacterium]|jgi:type IV pilus assembly protein PilW